MVLMRLLVKGKDVKDIAKGRIHATGEGKEERGEKRERSGEDLGNSNITKAIEPYFYFAITSRGGGGMVGHQERGEKVGVTREKEKKGGEGKRGGRGKGKNRSRGK